jgi:hypothetical protein
MIAILCLFWLLPVVAFAEGVVNLSPGLRMLDLSPHGTRVAAQRRNLKLDVPGKTDDARAVLELRAQGPGPEFNWTVYTLRNNGTDHRAFILAIDARRFAGSGVLRVEPFGSQLTSVQWLDTGAEHSQEASTTADAFRFELEPAQSITVGLEGRSVVTGARVYDEQAFAKREGSLAVLRGAVLAVGFVLALSIVSLYGIRTNRSFLVGGFFAFAVLLFASLESGYFDQLGLVPRDGEVGLQNLRAVVESLFALGLGLLLWGLTGLHRRKRELDKPYLAVIFVLVALVSFAIFVPQPAVIMARYASVLLAIAGFVLAVRGSRRGADMMDNAVLFWGALLLWVFLAGLAAASESPTPAWHAAMLTGLIGVVGLLAFASLRLAFAQGFLAKPYLKDSSRRSLALTGAQHFLWDWQPQDGVLDVGTELARSLGHPIEKLTANQAARWFAALIARAWTCAAFSPTASSNRNCVCATPRATINGSRCGRGHCRGRAAFHRA